MDDTELGKEDAGEEKLDNRSDMTFLIDSMMSVEGLRIKTQIRDSHLKRNGRQDQKTQIVLEWIRDLEHKMDELVAADIVLHPAYPWFSQIKGIGKENIAKVVGPIDITKPNTISGLWKFCGYHVVDGHQPKPVKGQKLDFNRNLRTMCWRLGGSLMKARGKYFDYYNSEKEKYVAKYINRGMKIVPAAQLPTRVNAAGKKTRYEPDGMISEGHVHAQALRKMTKLFLSHLWLVWRKAESLPIREPYCFEHDGHTTFISPEEMIDKPTKKAGKRGRPKKITAPASL